MLPIGRKEFMLLGTYSETCGGGTFSEGEFSRRGTRLFFSSILDRGEHVSVRQFSSPRPKLAPVTPWSETEEDKVAVLQSNIFFT